MTTFTIAVLTFLFGVLVGVTFMCLLVAARSED
jgi:hypothetical protein